MIARHEVLEPLLSSPAHILDVKENFGSTQPVLNGRFVVKVPDSVPIQSPANLGDLLTKKAAGYLVAYAGYTRCTSDPLLDATNVDLTNSSGGQFGSRSNVVMQNGGVFQSLPVALTGGAPSQAIVTWDTFYTNQVDLKATASGYSRLYGELASNSGFFTCQVSFDGGAHFVSTTDSATVGITHTGTSFIIQLTDVNAGPNPISIGSWSVIY
jgi:hypothetical protein